VQPLWFLVTVVAAALLGWTAVAIAAVGAMYATALTLVHHSVHGSLGMGRFARHACLTFGGILSLHSGHAIEATHLRHHETDPTTQDVEGRIEAMPWRRMPVESVLFRYRLWAWGFRHGRRRPLIATEISVSIMGAVVAIATARHGGRLGIVAVLITTLWLADVAFALLAAKGPQTNWGRPATSPLVRITCKYSKFLLISHNWHLEHHFYPQVPIPRLGEVAERLYAFDADDRLGEAFAGIVDVRLP
jgi:beta-carotene hydroxylase